MKKPLIVAIDGPSGAGKSTVARILAQKLGVPYIDTGAMYRTVGLAAREAGIPRPIPSRPRVETLARSLQIELLPDAGGTRVLCNARDVTEAIRQPEISRYASAVSAIPGVRRCLVPLQRRLARDRGGVLEGRDIGSKVFPKAPHKFFLTASVAERAGRRARELAAHGTAQPYETVLRELEQRDADDSNRADSPLRLGPGYVLIDSTGLGAA
ncbi:MAG TPA: (d)CMP kinase, partial [Thermoanaerobaculia bacterium]|nr:(d)CMP kinase [Thermoanaerobaculia bacterium]